MSQSRDEKRQPSEQGHPMADQNTDAADAPAPAEVAVADQPGKSDGTGADGAERKSSSSIGGSEELGAMATLKRGFQLSPELTKGIWITLVVAVVATAGRMLLPIVVQQVTDNGILADGGPDLGFVTWATILAALAVVLTGACSYAVNVRLFKASERGLAGLRTKAFRHIHDLSVLTQSTERRGALVSRVTSDVDTVSMFVQFGGIMFIVSTLQVFLAIAIMLAYNVVLALVAIACFVPMLFVVRRLQPIVGRGYTRVRARVGDMLGVVSETIVGAMTIRSYGVQERSQKRMDEAVEEHRKALVGAQIRAVLAFCTGQFVAGMTTTMVMVVGTWMAAGGNLTLGELLAFLFLVNLFTQPLLMATEILNELQNAVAGWRRVIGIIDTPADVADPEDGVTQADGPVEVRYEDVAYAYPGGEKVLRDVNLALSPGRRVAVVGETGSGKTTLAKLLTRLMDPVEGRVTVDGVDLRDLAFETLRRRIVMVPQEGFLFDTSLLANMRFADPSMPESRVEEAVEHLGLSDWVATLPNGLATQVGQRGESLSAGERQLVALVRAYLADPDLLVLDEATSAVDPSTEVRIQRALDELTKGRSSVAIAHRLSTAEAADEVIVVDKGRIVERGHHRDLVNAGGVYTRLHASWAAQQQH